MPNGSDEYLGFASGRRGCEKLDITLTTDASHDLLVTAYRLVRQILDFNYDSGENKVVRPFSCLDVREGPDMRERRSSTLLSASPLVPLEPSSALPSATAASYAPSATLAGISYVAPSPPPSSS